MARAKAKATNGADPARTGYVVLRQAHVREEPVDESPVTEVAWLPVTALVGKGTPEAYWEPVIFTAASKTAAIRQHTGEGAEVIEGTWKAVPVSSWRGGETTKRITAAERLPLEGV